MNQLDSGTEKEHIRYCRTLPILHDWPVSLLARTRDVCNFHYFKKGTVMAKSNHDTPFVYIVKSGRVRVLTKITKMRQRQGSRARASTAVPRSDKTKEGEWKRGSARARSETPSNQCYPNSLRSRMHSAMSNSSSRRHVRSAGTPHMRAGTPLLSKSRVGQGTFQEVPIQPTFLEVCVLGAGDSFGLSTLVYKNEITCGIVSLGAECIEISKEFFLKHATEKYLRKLKALVRPFPSDEKLQQDLQNQKLWRNYKDTVIAEVLDPSAI